MVALKLTTAFDEPTLNMPTVACLISSVAMKNEEEERPPMTSITVLRPGAVSMLHTLHQLSVSEDVD